jgi:hypothetical protein
MMHIILSGEEPHAGLTITRQGESMLPQLFFFASVAFSFVTWGIVAARYIWPKLRGLDRTEALRPILILHSFRFFGLAFLIPGVVSANLPSTFAQYTAYGDFVAAILALLTLLMLSSRAGSFLAWIFNIWGAADLLNAFYQGNHAGLVAGQLGATYVIPTLIVPLLLITHGLAFRILLQRQHQTATLENRHFA